MAKVSRSALTGLFLQTLNYELQAIFFMREEVNEVGVRGARGLRKIKVLKCQEMGIFKKLSNLSLGFS